MKAGKPKFSHQPQDYVLEDVLEKFQRDRRRNAGDPLRSAQGMGRR
jgi:hypothetical protein